MVSDFCNISRYRDLRQLEADVGRYGRLHDWVTLAWPHVEATPFVDGWHIEAMSEALEDVSALRVRDLVINLPPGMSKSSLVHVLWPVWQWLRDGSVRFLSASHDLRLVGQRDGGKILALMSSQWFRERWGNLLTTASPSAYDFGTTAGGRRISLSPNSRGIGLHGNIVTCDDPIKPSAVRGGSLKTRAVLQSVSAWWAFMSTRRADPATHRRVMIMQRLHKADPAGECIDAGYTVLRLPMRYEAGYPNRWDRRTVDGELLEPKRFPESVVQALEKDLREDAAAQLQQRPTAKGGAIFRRSYWRFWGEGNEPCLCDLCVDAGVSAHDTGRPCTALPEAGADLQSWDLAFKAKASSDFVAGGVWRAQGGRFFLRHVVNERLGFSDTKRAILYTALAYPTATRILIEDAANGPAVENELSQDLPGIEMVRPDGGKEARANAVEALLADGSVYLPKSHPLVYSLIRQAEAFPNDTHDDMVDMLTQALVFYRANGYTTKLESAMDRMRKELR